MWDTVILYSFGIDSNIIYSIKHLTSEIFRIFDITNYYHFFHFLEYDGNDLKIDCRSLF